VRVDLPKSIVIRTLSERVFEIVRERIVKGELGKDAPIRQDALASELGVSKIPLREALGRLEQEGLLVSQANRGYFVRPMSGRQMDEIFDLRLRIEPNAAAAACRVATDEERNEAKRAYAALDAVSNVNLSDAAVRNRQFHVALVQPGGRLLTTQLVERLAILAERYVVAHLKPAGRDSRAQSEHRALLEAWMERDGRAVVKQLTLHIRGTLEDLHAQFAASTD
jgi:DNA-binding GntR family transcriptional regulator